MALVSPLLDDTQQRRVHSLMPAVTVRTRTVEDSRSQSHVAIVHDHRTTRDSEDLLFTARTGQVAHIVGANAGVGPRNQNIRPGRVKGITNGIIGARFTERILEGPYPTRP